MIDVQQDQSSNSAVLEARADSSDFENNLSTGRGMLRGGTGEDQQAIDFRVTLVLATYGYGAMTIAKHLLRRRGMVQSWKKMGERHHLAKAPFNRNKVEHKLWKIRRVMTFGKIDYHIASRLFEYNLSSAYIASKLGVPTSTVITWRNGNSPVAIRQGFVDKDLIDAKYNSLLEEIKKDLTEKNLAYFLTMKLFNESQTRKNNGLARGLGARSISQILTSYIHLENLPERTVTSWIKNERRPFNFEPRLVHEEFLQERFDELVLEMTKQNIGYHLAMRLFKNGWTYSSIALFLELPKEKVRGWVKKGRGNLSTKTFVNPGYVQKVLSTMLVTAYGQEAAVQMDGQPPKGLAISNAKNDKTILSGSGFSK